MTCWPMSAGEASCLASKSYKTKGSDCELLFGRTSCADGLVCITATRALDAGADTGRDTGPRPTSEPVSLCASWCDDTHACAAGEDCKSLSLDGFSARVCVPGDLTPPDTGVPDSAPPDTYRPDTYKPDTGADTSVTDGITDSEMDTEPPADTGAPDTEPPPDTTPPDDTATDAAAD